MEVHETSGLELGHLRVRQLDTAEAVCSGVPGEAAGPNPAVSACVNIWPMVGWPAG